MSRKPVRFSSVRAAATVPRAKSPRSSALRKRPRRRSDGGDNTNAVDVAPTAGCRSGEGTTDLFRADEKATHFEGHGFVPAEKLTAGAKMTVFDRGVRQLIGGVRASSMRMPLLSDRHLDRHCCGLPAVRGRA